MRINECVCIRPCAHTDTRTYTHACTHSLGLAEDQPALRFWLVGLGRRPMKVLMAEMKTMHDVTAGRAVWKSLSAPIIV